MATRCRLHGRRGIWWHVMKIYGRLARNIGFEVANFEVHKKTRATQCENLRKSRGESSKTFPFLRVFNQAKMSFCAPGVPPRDILTCLQIVPKVGLCDRNDFCARFQTMTCMCRGWRSTLNLSVVFLLQPQCSVNG